MLIARGAWVAIRIVVAINVLLNPTPRARVAREVFPATAWVIDSATVGCAMVWLSSKGIDTSVDYIVGTIYHIRIVQQYAVIRDLPGSVIGDRCRKSNASRETDESKS